MPYLDSNSCSVIPLVRLACAIALLVSVCINAGAQDAAVPPDKSAPGEPKQRTTTSKSPNVRNGEISAIDAIGDTLTLHERTGKPAVYVLTDKTHYTKNRRIAERTDFKVGDTVVLRFRKSRTDGAQLVTELDDAASWNWLAELRKMTMPATIALITDNTLSVKVGVEALPFDYTISDKTRWEKGGHEVDVNGFKAGDRVFVVPRSLPSGAVMARAVSDTTAGAIQEKERLATSVHGVVVSVDLPGHLVVVKTVGGDTRKFAISDETEIIVNSKPMPLGTLRQGLHVVVRVRHDAEGDEIAWRFTVESTKRASTVKKPRPIGKGAVIKK